MSTPTHEPIKVCIVGSGITGLALAFYLSHPQQNGRFDVTIYESHHRLGLDSQSICFEGDNFADGSFEDDVDDRVDGSAEAHFISWSDQEKDKRAKAEKELQQKETAQSVDPNKSPQQKPKQTHPKERVRIDMPLRVFSTRYYPHLTTLLESLEVEYSPENYEASFVQFDGTPIFQYNNLLLGRYSIPYIPPSNLLQPVSRDIIRFLYCAPRDLRNGRLVPPPDLVTTFDLLNAESQPQPDVKPGSEHITDKYRHETLLEYLTAEGYSEEFIFLFEIPLAASICTCSFEAASQYPAYIIIQYQTLRSGSGVRRVKSGVNKVVKGLSQYIEHVKCSSAVTQIKHLGSTNGSELNNIDDIDGNSTLPDSIHDGLVEITDSNGERNVYNHVIFATQANQTCKILHSSLFGPKAPAATSSSLSTSLESLSLSIDQSTPETTQQQPSAAPDNWYQLYDTLSKIPYESSELILHGDERFLPPNKDNWRNVNFLLPDLETAKSFVHTPPQLIPTNLSNDVMQNGLVENDTTSPTDSNSSPIIPPSPNSLLSPLPQSLESPTSETTPPGEEWNGQQQCGLLSTTSLTDTTTSQQQLNEPQLMKQFSDNWLLTIQRQPSAHAQRHALVMNTKMVSQDEGMSTIWMNKVQNGIKKDCNIFQTWNPYVGIITYGVNSAEAMAMKQNDLANGIKLNNKLASTMGQHIAQRSAQVWGMESVNNLYGRSFFQRPIVTFDSISACGKLWELNGKSQIWSLGSFSLGGVPLLESGVASAYVVAIKLGAVPVMKPSETVRESQLPPAVLHQVTPQLESTGGISRDQSDMKQRQQQKRVDPIPEYPILGWVNNASNTNSIVELVIGLIYYILCFIGVYGNLPSTKPQDKKKKKD